MAKQVAQVRYFGEGHSLSNTTKKDLTDGTVFNYPIVQLGIQALPGTQVLINAGGSPLIIGATGIYELDLDGLANITELKFYAADVDKASVQNGIIVDYIYKGKDE